MDNAQALFKARHPSARVVRSTFGLVVQTEDGETFGDGRAYYAEEAWVSAIEEIED